jgi:putative glutamine amidotransferase
VDAAACTPMLLPTLHPPVPVDDWLTHLDGLLLTGSASNIEPHHYSDEPSWPGNEHDPARDQTTLALVPRALELGLPVLAICRGFQEVNVALGGTLHRRCTRCPACSTIARTKACRSTSSTARPIRSRWPRAAGWPASRGDHRQCFPRGGQLPARAGVDQLAPGLIVEATAPDGLVEAFRREGEGFLLALQWHPEWHVMSNPFYLGIFQAFGEACRRHAERKRTR